jgi:hypothetical protein
MYTRVLHSVYMPTTICNHPNSARVRKCCTVRTSSYIDPPPFYNPVYACNAHSIYRLTRTCQTHTPACQTHTSTCQIHTPTCQIHTPTCQTHTHTQPPRYLAMGCAVGAYDPSKSSTQVPLNATGPVTAAAGLPPNTVTGQTAAGGSTAGCASPLRKAGKCGGAVLYGTQNLFVLFLLDVEKENSLQYGKISIFLCDFAFAL